MSNRNHFLDGNYPLIGRIGIAFLFALLVLHCTAIYALNTSANQPHGGNDIPYLLLVWSRMQNFDQQAMKLLEESHYNGTALKPFSAGYDGPIPDLENYISLLDDLNELKSNSTKALWPAVYLNRIVGYHPDEPPGSSEYFRKIDGIDLDNESGARADFEKIFTLALQMARHLESPGIVLDLEAYNAKGSGVNPVYHMNNLMYIRGETENVLVQKLQSFGHSLADIAAQTYPGCKIMFLFTSHDWSVAEIVVGMLDRTRELDSGVHMIDGGEVGIGYCSEDVEHLRSKIREREEVWAEKFPYPPDLFSLGGTICPYLNRSKASSFLLNNGPQIKTLRDFEPLFHELFDAFDLIWIYSGGSDYTPLNPNDAAVFNEVFGQMIDNYKAYGKKSPKLVENLVEDLRNAIIDAAEDGVETTAYNQSMDDVISLCDQDRYPEAYDLVETVLSSVTEAHENAKISHAQELISKAEEKIALAKHEGIDTSRCELFLSKARQALEEGQYRSVESMCACALNLQEKIPESITMTFLANVILSIVLIHLSSRPHRNAHRDI